MPVLLALLAAPAPAAQRPYHIEYAIAMPDVGSHLYAITLSVSGVTARTVNLQMPVWSPGRYGRMDFGKNVQDFAAATSDGQPLRWERVNGSLWRVFTGWSRSMRVSYRVFANCTMSGTFSHLDSPRAHRNGGSRRPHGDAHTRGPEPRAI